MNLFKLWRIFSNILHPGSESRSQKIFQNADPLGFPSQGVCSDPTPPLTNFLATPVGLGLVLLNYFRVLYLDQYFASCIRKQKVRKPRN